MKKELPEEKSRTGQSLPKFVQKNDKEIGLSPELGNNDWDKFTKQILGTCNEDAFHYLSEQLLPTVKGCTQNTIANGFNKMTPLLAAINPQDELEAMLAVQMVGVHNMSMDMMRRALHTDRVDHLNNYSNQVAKMTRTFIAQIEALNKHRGKGQQKVTVEHVHVNEGGQALVGNVGRGEHGKEN